MLKYLNYKYYKFLYYKFKYRDSFGPWMLWEVDEETRKELYLNANKPIVKLYGTSLTITK